MAEDAASCASCIFRFRFGFRRALYEQLFLVRGPCGLVVVDYLFSCLEYRVKVTKGYAKTTGGTQTGCGAAPESRPVTTISSGLYTTKIADVQPFVRRLFVRKTWPAQVCTYVGAYRLSFFPCLRLSKPFWLKQRGNVLTVYKDNNREPHVQQLRSRTSHW